MTVVPGSSLFHLISGPSAPAQPGATQARSQAYAAAHRLTDSDEADSHKRAAAAQNARASGETLPRGSLINLKA